jgi:glycosyltransferase involved in cell wall biosynthesis
MSIESSTPATPGRASYSLVIPVYGNEGSIPELLKATAELHEQLGRRLEVVFVVDGSPDRSQQVLEAQLPRAPHPSRLVQLSRNFGSFAAIRAGLAEAEGDYFAVMAADLQEPPELVGEFFEALENEPVEVVVGVRAGRDDPALGRWLAETFWAIYRRFIQPEMPPGGVDVFGCNRAVRDHLLGMEESNSALVGILVWLGFRRKEIAYQRRRREHGRSGWTFGRKLRYLFDSVYAFSDLPIRLLLTVGALGLVVSFVFGVVVVIARIQGDIEVPGYAAVVLTIVFFGALNLFGLGIIGSYLWRAFENTKSRPQAVVLSTARFDGKGG